MVRALYDDFATLGSGAELHGRTPSYVNPNLGTPTWATETPSTLLGDGSGRVRATGSGVVSGVQAAGPNHALFVDFTPASVDNRMFVLARGAAAPVLASGTWYDLLLKTSDAALSFRKRVAGSVTALGSDISISINTANWYTIGLGAGIGGASTLVAYWAAQGTKTIVGTLSDTSISSGTYGGIGHTNFVNGNARFDNFEVDNLVPLWMIARRMLRGRPC